MKNKSKFDSLKQILPILFFILLISFGANAQDSRTPNPATEQPGKLKPYPNPATTYITFDLQKNYQKGLSIVVYNFLGKKMYETQNVTEKTTINLSEFPRGVYIYHLTDPTSKVIDTGKFQVAR